MTIRRIPIGRPTEVSASHQVGQKTASGSGCVRNIARSEGEIDNMKLDLAGYLGGKALGSESAFRIAADADSENWRVGCGRVFFERYG